MHVDVLTAIERASFSILHDKAHLNNVIQKNNDNYIMYYYYSNVNEY